MSMEILKEALLGSIPLKNRVVMAPMTRSRADEYGVVGDLTGVYYTQRASAGLIISEAINISEQAIGMPSMPGIYTQAQIDAWRKVTDSVHSAGGRFFAQLYHAGRTAHSLNRKGQLPVSASAIAIINQKAYTAEGEKDFETPMELTTSGVKQVIQDFKTAAINAMEAGFDGIELHAALGYLPNQFLVESSNQRKDEYGGTIENRSRFVLEVIQEMIAAVGKEKVGIKLSPSIAISNMFESDPVALYSYLINALDQMPLAYIHLMQPLFPLDDMPHHPKDVLTAFGHLTSKNIIVNGGYNREAAEKEIENNRAQFVSFGSLFLANPDLPRRFELDAEVNQPDRATMYIGGDEKGYTDYPALNL
jgi:N-ethylmaleimide reductase